MTIPQITLEHWNKGLDFSRSSPHFSMLDAINKAIEIALAEQSAQPEKELSQHVPCESEPADKHAALRAEYAKQVAECPLCGSGDCFESSVLLQATETAELKAHIEHLKQVVIHDRIEWEDFLPASYLAFAQLLKD